jgi:hypothetical protein
VAAWLLLSGLVLGNDGSSEATPAGGIRLKREARISMEKERLTIGRDRVTVEYEFLNTTNQDITVEVAFPVPGFGTGFLLSPSFHGDLDGWRVWVEGKELKYQTEVKATVDPSPAVLGSPDGVDQAPLLRRMSVDIESLGHFHLEDDGRRSGDFQKLPAAQQEELTRAGLFVDGFPVWTVRKTYHWQQRFPAYRILHVKHEYAPELGLKYLTVDGLQDDGIGQHATLSDSCVDPSLRSKLLAAAPNDNGFGGGGFIPTTWVDYILTTANTWRTPIKDFELVVERPKPERQLSLYVSFCWDGKVEQRGPDTFVARVANFVPKRELRVMFFQVGISGSIVNRN